MPSTHMSILLCKRGGVAVYDEAEKDEPFGPIATFQTVADAIAFVSAELLASLHGNVTAFPGPRVHNDDEK